MAAKKKGGKKANKQASSAGGYLSLMLRTSAGVQELEHQSMENLNQASNVQAVVAWFAPTDFLKMDEQLTEWGCSLWQGWSTMGLIRRNPCCWESRSRKFLSW